MSSETEGDMVRPCLRGSRGLLGRMGRGHQPVERESQLTGGPTGGRRSGVWLSNYCFLLCQGAWRYKSLTHLWRVSVILINIAMPSPLSSKYFFFVLMFYFCITNYCQFRSLKKKTPIFGVPVSLHQEAGCRLTGTSAQCLNRLKSRCCLGLKTCEVWVLLLSSWVVGKIQFPAVVGLTPDFSAGCWMGTSFQSLPCGLSSHVTIYFFKASRTISLTSSC